MEGTCLELGTAEALQLPGFGVELAIKNMEYSAMDDTKVGTVYAQVTCEEKAYLESLRQPLLSSCQESNAACHQQDGAGAMSNL